MFCEKCGKELQAGSSICPACGYNPAAPHAPAQPQNYQQPYAYNQKSKKSTPKTAKIFAGMFKNLSWVVLLTAGLGILTILFSFISSIIGAFMYGGFYTFLSGLTSTIFYAMITVFVVVKLAKIDYKDE